jgi:hypothetical protein
MILQMGGTAKYRIQHARQLCIHVLVMGAIEHPLGISAGAFSHLRVVHQAVMEVPSAYPPIAEAIVRRVATAAAAKAVLRQQVGNRGVLQAMSAQGTINGMVGNGGRLVTTARFRKRVMNPLQVRNSVTVKSRRKLKTTKAANFR